MKKLFKFVTDDILTKMASVVLAVLVWFMVQGEVTTRRTMHGITYNLMVNKDMIVTRQEDEFLRVILSGPQEVIQELNKSAVRISHDLTSIRTPGAVVFSLLDQDIVIPPRTQIVSIHPKQLKVYLDQVMEKELPVKVKWVGQPESGFQVKDAVVNPDLVRIQGPKSALEQVTEIKTESVLLTGRSRSFVQSVGLERIVHEGPTEDLPDVDVYVRMEPIYSQLIFEKVPISILGLRSIESPIRLAEKEVEVVVAGSEEVLKKVQLEDLRAYVDVSGLKAGKYQVPISIMNIQNVELKSVKPNSVEVEIFDRLEKLEGASL